MSLPDGLALRRAALESRARVLSAIRRWFEEQGFLEVETPARVRAPGQEAHLDAIASEDRWLVTSPEYAMKRLCGAGYRRIVSVGKCWRAGEVGAHHQPEFTMIEWYRAEEPLERIADDCEQLLRLAARIVAEPASALSTQDRGAPSRPQPTWAESTARFGSTTVRALLMTHAGFTLRGDESTAELAAKAGAAGVKVGAAETWDDIFFQIWLDRVEPALAAASGPLFVYDWPVPLGALARRRTDDRTLVERFELYAGGLELANAFGELTDPVEQRARFESESAARRARGKVTYPIDEKLLESLARMPPTCGVALGFDRLMMLVLGARSIDEVIAFPENDV